MKKWLIFVSVFFIESYTWSLAQVIPGSTDPTVECPFVKLSVGLDSTGLRLAMDSISKVLSGQWKLVEVAGGWHTARKPSKVVKMLLDSQGRGMIYEEGQRVSTYQLTLNEFYRYMRFSIIEKEGTFFDFSPKSRGYLRLCQQTLILRVNAAEGEAYVFERVSSK